MSRRLKIWVHFANSPHVPLLAPVIEEFEKLGHEVSITCRDFAQTVQLASNYGLNYTLIEKHGGSSLLKKSFNLVSSAYSMMRWARQKKFDLALSHNSYSQALATYLLRIPMVTMMDYEYQPANHISFRLATKVLVPALLPDEVLEKLGAKAEKVDKYTGLKEQIYLSQFTPNSRFLESLGLNPKKIIAVLRPPATMATYHRFENTLFDEVVEYLANQSNITNILLPRTQEQKAFFESKQHPNVLIPPSAVDGRNLIYHSDLVISAGGTMNREAAVLGIPTYTVYAGKMGSIDSYLISVDRMVQIQTSADISKIKVCKKDPVDQSILDNKELLHEVVGKILTTMRSE